ncbi:Flp pilus assembly protein CpaB [Novosphingobium umbonatum]|uniref:Flp pilus assembly protein CpaB n=1 Tax=Novosphingobium umbonatum TaxID=1908524 RepID=A0A3S2Y735_9SPHN|nr:Flp pilus assembly protein CpaB [Novosphingobium umbonatum]RVU03765.1 Flp pilus assembly protein CpaB [Novosphingobium umbonatum]
MERKKLMLLLGATVMAVATAMAARSMLSNNGAAPAVQAALPVAPRGPRVLVAQRALGPGTIITADAVTFQDWPQNMVGNAYLVDGAVDMNKLIGTVVRYPITAGQPLTQGALVAPGDRGFLAAALGAGMRAVTITVSEKSGVAGFIFPGDRVDVMLTQSIKGLSDAQSLNVTETVLRNLRVLATDQSTENETANGKTLVRTFHTVTLEVTPKIAEKIEVAQAVGALSLTLRPLADGANDLDRAVAQGAVKLPAGADRKDEERALAFAMTRPQDTGSSLTTGGDISRFQSRSLPTAAPAQGLAHAGGGMAPAATAPARPRGDAFGVRVTRGKETQTVSFSGASTQASGAPANLGFDQGSH